MAHTQTADASAEGGVPKPLLPPPLRRLRWCLKPGCKKDVETWIGGYPEKKCYMKMYVYIQGYAYIYIHT